MKRKNVGVRIRDKRRETKPYKLLGTWWKNTPSMTIKDREIKGEGDKEQEKKKGVSALKP